MIVFLTLEYLKGRKIENKGLFLIRFFYFYDKEFNNELTGFYSSKIFSHNDEFNFDIQIDSLLYIKKLKYPQSIDSGISIENLSNKNLDVGSAAKDYEKIKSLFKLSFKQFLINKEQSLVESIINMESEKKNENGSNNNLKIQRKVDFLLFKSILRFDKNNN